ncbi:hypothetical protein ZWY2020_030508 [Hordeum vulgare]|nr:hypothetical protein ZWY2020_030508 [Hordeum vulgare]
MVVQEFAVDLDKPLVFQVGPLEEHYQEWVHQPIVSKEGPRFFANDTMEFLTRTKWWAVPVIWLPVVCWLFAKSILMGHTIQELILMALFGVFVWTLIEYSLHRFLFHIETKSYWSNTAHYLIHGCHHKHPMDSLRLVFLLLGQRSYVCRSGMLWHSLPVHLPLLRYSPVACWGM